MPAELTVFSALRAAVTKAVPQNLRSVNERGWSTQFFGRSPYDFQRDIEISRDCVMANWSVFACITLIASDIGKLRLRLVENIDGIWQEAESTAFSPVLRKPNKFQTRQKFIEAWMVSKLSHGNTYVLKERDKRGVVVALYVLDPSRVKVLVSPNGSVYYQLHGDNLAGVPDDSELPAVPASEIIHDTMVCLFHPLVGVSPIFACGLAATQGLEIQTNSAKFFKNMSRPSGILTSDNEIKEEYAAALKLRWEQNYSANNTGKVAVLGSGLKYQGLTVNAVDADLVQQLKMTAEMVCSTFHIPAFKIGAGTIPAGQKVEDLNQIYYTDCLQALMESAEALLDEGLGLDEKKEGKQLGTEFSLDDLLKMDSATMTDVLVKQTGGGISKIDEARKRLNLPPTPGGDTPYLQQQNYSLAALAKRDSQEDPFGTEKPDPAPRVDTPPKPDPEEAKAIVALMERAGRSDVVLDQVLAALGEIRTASEARLSEIAAQAASKEEDARRMADAAIERAKEEQIAMFATVFIDMIDSEFSNE